MKKNKKNGLLKSKIKKTASIDPFAKSNFDEYLDMFSLEKRVVNDNFITKLAIELVDWAINDETALKLSQFFLKKGIHFSDIDRWKKKNENLEKAHRFALMAIGNRRELGALNRKLAEGTINSSMPMYDPDWKELAEWRSRLTKKEQSSGHANYTIIMEKFDNSPVVPSLSKSDCIEQTEEKSQDR